jgi:hypothetical protein
MMRLLQDQPGWALILFVVGGYVASLYLHPYTACPAGKGSARHRGCGVRLVDPALPRLLRYWDQAKAWRVRLRQGTPPEIAAPQPPTSSF